MHKYLYLLIYTVLNNCKGVQDT